MRTPRIDQARATGPAQRTRSSGSAASGLDFARFLSTAAAEAAEAAVELHAPSALDSLLGVQEVTDDGAGGRRRAAARYGSSLLDRLDRLRLEMLEGGASVATLGALAQTLRAERQRSEDPRLDTVLDEIELRAEIEMAKLLRFA